MRRISSGGLLLAAGLALTGGVLLWNALFTENGSDLPPWEPVNGQLEAALQAVNGSTEDAAGSGSGSSSGTDWAKDSGINSGTKNGADSGASRGANSGEDGAKSGGSLETGLGEGQASSPADKAAADTDSGTGHGAAGHGAGAGGSRVASQTGGESGARGNAEVAGPAGGSPAQTTGAPEAAAADNRLDLNRASAEQLQELPGIGPAKAKAIVEDRQQNGFYRSVDDITRVKGIGPKMLAKMRPLITAVP